MDFEIREIGREQLEESARIIRAAFGTVAAEFGFTAENNPTNGAFIRREKLEEELARGVKMFGLYGSGGQMGFVALEQRDGRLYYLEKLAVAPEYRHAGGGKRLMDHACAFVKKAGGAEISIAIIDENTRLKEWYKGYGFRETGRKRFDHLSFTVCFLSLAV